MKNFNYVINGVLAVAVIILFVLQFSGKTSSALSSGAIMTSSEDQSFVLPVAYINVDSLLGNYIFSIDLTEALTRKTENLRASLTQQERNFQAEVDNFNYRLQNNAFTSQARVDQEQRRLQQKSADLQAQAERRQMDLMEENQQINMQLRDTIMSHLKEFNKTKGYQIIYSNSSESIISPILWAEDTYNITTEFTDYLNKKWSPPSGN
jgi:outer membrane protein